MAEFVFVVSTQHNNYPNITVYDRFYEGVQRGWEIRANDGYVFYDVTENNVELNPDTMEEVPVTYYYTIASIPSNYNWDNFQFLAVPRDSVDENYIFGGGDDTEHEAM